MKESDSSTCLQALKDAVRGFCEERDWDRFHGAKELAIGISTEAGELLEHFRFLSDSEVESLFEDPQSRKSIEEELADVLIFVLRFGQKYEVDLAQAVMDKLAANARRYPVEATRGSNRKMGREGA